MSAFNSVLKQHRTRNFGGTSNIYACEPYISGFFFIKWYLPETLTNFLNSYTTSIENNQTDFSQGGGKKQTCENILSAACVGVTPPGQSIDFVEYRGSCGVVWNNPMRVNYGHSLNIKYIEMSGLPIYRIHKCWIDMIRDAHQGVEGKPYEPETTFQKQNYAGSVLYWTTKPDGCTPEYCCAYSGVIPERDNQESFGSDISGIDKVELDMSYRIDHLWTDQWVWDEVKKVQKSAPFGAKNGTLWSRDGFMNSRKATSANQMSSKL